MLLIARYDCFINGERTGSVDYKVKSYDVEPDTDLELLLRSEPEEEYKNESSELVSWQFEEICAVEWEPDFSSGEEVIGFVTSQPVSRSGKRRS